MPTTNFPNGATNAADSSTLTSYIAMDRTKVHEYFEDFDYYTAGNWTVTETQAGATQALVNADGGVIALTNSAADNDLNQIQKVGESFLMASGKQAWFKARLKVSDATNTDVFVGLIITDTDPVGGITDGMYFKKAEDSTSIIFNQVKNSTASTVTAGTVVSDTYFTVGFHYDGGSETGVYFNDVRIGTITSNTNLPNDEELTPTLALQNGSAVAHVLSADYLFASKER